MKVPELTCNYSSSKHRWKGSWKWQEWYCGHFM